MNYYNYIIKGVFLFCLFFLSSVHSKVISQADKKISDEQIHFERDMELFAKKYAADKVRLEQKLHEIEGHHHDHHSHEAEMANYDHARRLLKCKLYKRSTML